MASQPTPQPQPNLNPPRNNGLIRPYSVGGGGGALSFRAIITPCVFVVFLGPPEIQLQQKFNPLLGSGGAASLECRFVPWVDVET